MNKTKQIMETRLKEVLHLYLGCECIRYYGAKNQLKYKTEIRSITEGGIVTTGLPRFPFTQAVHYSEIKPILRPLSDIKGVEYDEWASIVIQRRDNSIRSQFYDMMENAERTKYLLSKGFDLFGLIEAGLAIDATKLNKGV